MSKIIDLVGLSVAIQNIKTWVQSLLQSKADRATTLAGYGITDAYTSVQVETRLANLGLLDAASLVEITYAGLVELRNNNTLMPGRFYRIVDYITTTTQENTSSAGYQFDVVVLATSTNTLSEDAYTIMHNFDQEENNVNICQLEDNDEDTGVYNLTTTKTTEISSSFTYDIPYFTSPDEDTLTKTGLISDTITLKSVNNEGVLSFTSDYFGTDITGDEHIFNTPIFKTIQLYDTSTQLYLTTQSVYLPNPDVNFSTIWLYNRICIDAITGYLYRVKVGNSSLIKYALISNTKNDSGYYDCYLFVSFPIEARPSGCNVGITQYTQYALSLPGINALYPFSRVTYSYDLKFLKQIGRGQQALFTSANKPATYSNLKSELESHFEDSKLNVWNIKYCLDNDSNRFAWADEANGKGVIYHMIDEFGNDCPYDFKNILFTTKYGIDYIVGYYYTIGKFETTVDDLSVSGDASLEGKSYNNIISTFYNDNKRKINNCILLKGEEPCYNNTFTNCSECVLHDVRNSKLDNCTQCELYCADNIQLYNCHEIYSEDTYASNTIAYYTSKIALESNLFIFNGNILANNVYPSNQ